jgi:hypothetical protein
MRADLAGSTVFVTDEGQVVTICKSVVFGFAMCGGYSGGAGLPHIRALQDLDVNHAVDGVPVGSARLGDLAARGGTRASVVAAIPVAGVVVAVAFGHLRHPLANLDHLRLVLGAGLLRLAARDLLLIGSALSILVVLGFAVLVTEMAGTSVPHRPSLLRVVARGPAPATPAGRPPRRPPNAVRAGQRPPTIMSGRPDSRRAALRPVHGRLRR